MEEREEIQLVIRKEVLIGGFLHLLNKERSGFELNSMNKY